MYCIYKITNKINGKTYIGQHKYKDLNDSYMGSGILLAKAKAKYGIENFEKEILYSKIQYKETADDVERFAIKKERSLGKAEYNIANGGQGGNLGEDVNKKISESNKGKHHIHLSEETKRKMSEAHKGHSTWNKGKNHSEEYKRKLSETLKGRSAWNKGKCFSDGTKRKMSESKKGKHWKLVDGKRVWY